MRLKKRLPRKKRIGKRSLLPGAVGLGEADVPWKWTTMLSGSTAVSYSSHSSITLPYKP